jgi:hypothetical protein
VLRSIEPVGPNALPSSLGVDLAMSGVNMSWESRNLPP